MYRQSRSGNVVYALLAAAGLGLTATCLAEDPATSWPPSESYRIFMGLCVADPDYCYPAGCQTRANDEAPFTCGGKVWGSNKRIDEQAHGTCRGRRGYCLNLQRQFCALVQVYERGDCEGVKECQLWIIEHGGCDPNPPPAPPVQSDPG